MVGLKGALHPGLLDEKFWSERLQEEAAVPLRMLVLPSGSSGEGTEAFELMVSGRDGERLHGVLVRRAHHEEPEPIGVRGALRLVPGHADHPALEHADCEAELYFEPAPHKRLEERVLDTLRMLRAARRVEGVAGARALAAGNTDELPPPDEFLIAECLLNRGWI